MNSALCCVSCSVTAYRGVSLFRACHEVTCVSVPMWVGMSGCLGVGGCGGTAIMSQSPHGLFGALVLAHSYTCWAHC